MILKTAEQLVSRGVKLMRAGRFKRTSPILSRDWVLKA